MKHFLTILFLILIGTALYGLTIRGVYGNPQANQFKDNLDQATKPFELSPERGRFLLTMSLAQDHSFALRHELGIAAMPDVGYFNNKFYVFFAPGISLWVLPFYLLGYQHNISQVASFMAIAVFGIFNLICIYLIARNMLKLPCWAGVVAALIFGFASTSWSYAITLYQHHVTTFFILSSFYAVWKYKQRSPIGFLYILYVWVAYGLAVWIDYPNAILMLPVMVYLALNTFIFSAHLTDGNVSTQGGAQSADRELGIPIREGSHLSRQTSVRRTQALNSAIPRSIPRDFASNFTLNIKLIPIITSLAFFAVMALHGYYNYTQFGDWKKLSGSIVGYTTYQKLQKLSPKERQKQMNATTSRKEPLKFFREENTMRGLYTLLFAPDKGIFYFTPIFILALFGILSMLKKTTLEHGVLFALTICNIFLYSSFGDPWGGWAFGPRYLIPFMAYGSLFIAYWVSQKKLQFLRRLLVLPLFFFSSAVSLIGVLTTNQIPPQIEADYLKMKFGYYLAYDYFAQGRSGTFAYNQLFANYMSLQQYGYLILATVVLIVTVTLFVVPVLYKKTSDKGI